MKCIPTFLSLALSVGIVSCASTETYGPAESDRAGGYSERAIEEGRYRVTYRSPTLVLARDRALRRAAELTVKNGYLWFRVTSTTSEPGERTAKPSVTIGGSTGSHHSGVGVGIGLPFGGGSDMAEHSIEFLMGKGDAPNEPDVYNAASVLSAGA